MAFRCSAAGRVGEWRRARYRGTEARAQLALRGLCAAVPRLAQPGNVPAAAGWARRDYWGGAARTCVSQFANAPEDPGPVIAGDGGRDHRHDLTLQLVDGGIWMAPWKYEGRGIEFLHQVADLVELEQPRAAWNEQADRVLHGSDGLDQPQAMDGVEQFDIPLRRR